MAELEVQRAVMANVFYAFASDSASSQCISDIPVYGSIRNSTGADHSTSSRIPICRVISLVQPTYPVSHNQPKVLACNNKRFGILKTARRPAEHSSCAADEHR